MDWPIGTKFGTCLRIHLGMDIIMLETICPSIPQGDFFCVLRGQKVKNLGKLRNGETDWHQIWYTTADSSGNEHRLNKQLAPR